MRSRVEFIEKDEKSNRYFYNKEKESFDKKSVNSLKIGETNITEPSKILSELKQFYYNLYESRNPNVDSEEFEALINTEGIKQLSDADRDHCEGYITVEECKKALDTMQNGKSPGCDGLTAEFYKTFWPLVGPLLVDTLNYSAEHGELSQSQKRGVITLLQKKGRDPELIKNWRPCIVNKCRL